MNECTHNCSTCSSSCSEAEYERNTDLMEKLLPGAGVKKVIAVVSGKGGVGKSMVTSLLAVEMQRRGHNTAILDADMTGPSIPKAFGLHEKATATAEYMNPVRSRTGIQVMSINLLLENETQPVMWRGPVIAGVVTQFWNEVMWDNVDYMFVDMPPGTGDVPLTVFQGLPLDGIIIVTSPQELVSMIVEKAVNMAGSLKVPILGIVENMSYFQCPKCGEKHEMFGPSKVEATAKEFDIPNASRLPIDHHFTAMVDSGDIESSVAEELLPLVSYLEKL